MVIVYIPSLELRSKISLWPEEVKMGGEVREGEK